MRSSEKPSAQQPSRGFVPPRSEEERVLMRHAEDLAVSALRKGIARYSAFLSDREQSLCRAAMNRAGCGCFVFDGGYPDAERRVLCIEPEDAWPDRPIVCVRIRSRFGSEALQHKDYLGSLTGLEIKREGFGDIILLQEQPETAYVFALRPIAELIVRELREVGRVSVTAEIVEADSLPCFDKPERELQSATVSSLRLDSVLAAMLHCSRGMAAELIGAGRVEVNHVPEDSPSAAVYVMDIFTIRGKGRYQLVDLPGKSKKGRQIIEYFQF